MTIKRLSSGFYHIRGNGPCEWTQPPDWPCSEQVIRKHSFPQASESFIQAAIKESNLKFKENIQHAR